MNRPISPTQTHFPRAGPSCRATVTTAPARTVQPTRADGSIEVAWEGTIAFGTYYGVYRRVGATGAFTFVASSETRSFVDNDVTPGTNQIAYQLITRRDGLTSAPSAPTTVYLGVPGDEGEMAMAA